MGTAMSQALAAAIPGLQERMPLARQIETAEQVAGMPTDELERLHTAHEAECVRLAGQLEADPEARWARRARQALRVLHLHRGWISRELLRRKKAKAKAEHMQVLRTAAEARKVAQREATERQHAADEARMRRQHAADEARMRRIQASNDVNAQHIAIFKEVAREVLGAEMYEHLWELTRLRLGLTA